MNCQSCQQNTTFLKSLERRIARTEKAMAGFWEITGACTTAGQSIVALISIVQDDVSGIFTLIWSSLPGERFQVQTSTDGITWTVAADSIDAAETPDVMTEWESAEYDPIDDTPRYFRVRKYPTMLLPCTPAATTCPDIISATVEET